MLGQGRESAKTFLVEKPEIAKKISEEVMKKAKEGKPMIEVGVEEHEETSEQTS